MGHLRYMSRHHSRGTRISLWVDDGFGNLTRVNFGQIISRITTGWDAF